MMRALWSAASGMIAQQTNMDIVDTVIRKLEQNFKTYSIKHLEIQAEIQVPQLLILKVSK